MIVEKNYDFNAPVEVLFIFRFPLENKEYEEHGIPYLFSWEEVKAIEGYAFKDDWKTYKGEKYIINFYNDSPKLVLGSYASMKAHWTKFKTKYPIFRDENHKETKTKSRKKKAEEGPG